MWNDAGFRYFQHAVRAAQRSAWFTCYTLKWIKKSDKAEPCREKEWSFRTFQIYTGIMTLIVLPVVVARTFQLLIMSPQENRELKVYLATLVITDVACICVPFLWFFLKSSNLRKLIMSYETALQVDMQIQGGITE